MLPNDKNGKIYKLISIIFWLAVWSGAAAYIGRDIILPSPVQAAKALCRLAVTADYWKTILNSAGHIIGGFLSALLAGVILSVLSYKIKTLRYLISPLISVIKSTPVASFIILALFWMPSRKLSIFIAFLIVLPVVYTNVLEGISSVSAEMLEMTNLFRVSPVKKLLYVYVPEIMPFFISACRVSLGLCWKSGVAAEVIGQPDNTVGDALYRSKIYLETADLFAWTVTVIFISFLFERIFMGIISLTDKKIISG